MTACCAPSPLCLNTDDGCFRSSMKRTTTTSWMDGKTRWCELGRGTRGGGCSTLRNSDSSPPYSYARSAVLWTESVWRAGNIHYANCCCSADGQTLKPDNQNMTFMGMWEGIVQGKDACLHVRVWERVREKGCRGRGEHGAWQSKYDINEFCFQFAFVLKSVCVCNASSHVTGDFVGHADQASTTAGVNTHMQGRPSFAKPHSERLCIGWRPLHMPGSACSVWDVVCISSSVNPRRQSSGLPNNIMEHTTTSFTATYVHTVHVSNCCVSRGVNHPPCARVFCTVTLGSFWHLVILFAYFLAYLCLCCIFSTFISLPE